MATDLNRALLDAMIPVMRSTARTERLLRQKLGTAFRIADYAVGGYEVPLNKILANLLSPRGTHGQGDVFLRQFLDFLGLADTSSEKWHVVPNYPTIRKRYPDIALILPAKVAIYIESKPWALEGPDQLKCYCEDLLCRPNEPTKFLLFLPGRLTDHLTTSLTPELEQRLSGFKRIPFQRAGDGLSVVQWLEQCAARCEAQNARVFISDLADYLDTEFRDNGGKLMSDDLLADMIGKNSDYLRLAFKLERVAKEIRADIARSFLSNLITRLNIRLASQGWTIDNDFDPALKWSGIYVRQTHWPYGWGIRLSMEETNLRGFIIGFTCPSTTEELHDGQLADNTPLLKSGEAAKIYSVLDTPLKTIGRGVTKSAWWPAYCPLPSPFCNWTEETFLLASGLEPCPDGRSAVEVFASWLELLTGEVRGTVDDILANQTVMRD